MLTPSQVDRALQFFSRYQHFCIASHIRPDGDAIGSALALALGLLAHGKRVTVFNVDGVPAGLRFLPFSDRVVRSLADSKGIDALIVVDCTKPQRAGDPIVELAARLPYLVIDHHVAETAWRDQQCIDPSAAATGVLIAQLLQTMRCRLSPELATLLYCCLVVDTGQFRYSNTTPEVLRLAAELLNAGADPWHVASSLTEQQHPAALRLLRLALGTLELAEQGRLAWIVLTQEMLREAEALPEYAEDFVNFPRSIAGVEVAMLIRELPTGEWKVSLRSKNTIDVAAIAAQFDGGGHESAAGCTLSGPLAAVRARILATLHDTLTQRRPSMG